MYIGIRHDTRITDIQKEFNDQYPFLKLEFFKNYPIGHKNIRKAEKIIPGAYVNQVTRFYQSGSIQIDDERTVARLVEEFWDEFGLSVLIFRKSGNSWIETSLTDDWTLVKQNKIGESFVSWN